MKYFQSFSLLVRANLNSLIEKVEDPELMLHQLIRDMREELERTGGLIAEAVADEIQMRKRVEGAEQEFELWAQRCQRAIEKKQMDAAEIAAERKLEAEARLKRCRENHSGQLKETEKLKASLRELEDQLKEAENRKTMLVAKMARTQAAGKMRSSFKATKSDSAKAQFERLERELEREESLLEAHEELRGIDSGDAWDESFERQERRDAVQAEIDRVRQKIEAS
ncbi:MAG: PspA/IM30 family protein [Planctomycetota bacterium]